MTDIAALGISVDTSDVKTAVTNLDQLSKMGPPVERAAKDIGKGAEAAAKGTKKAGDEATRTSRNVGQMSESMRAATAMAKSFGAAIGSAFAFSKAVGTIKDFDESLLRLRATSGATGEAMAQMEKQARTLGATSQFSAQQAAEAQNFLAMAGLKTSEILQATGSVMKFAAAGALDLARSADIATNVLGGMQMPVDQLERVMDTLVNTAQSANTNIEQLGEAFSYAAPLATTAAIGVEELAAAAGALGDAGIQGGKAGTGLVGVIRQLSAVTDKGEAALAKYGVSLADIDIKANGLTTVLKTLGEAQLDTADAIHIFGTESAAAGLVLASSAEKVEQLADANEKAKGKLQEVSGIMETSLKAAFAGVTSAIEEMMLQTGDRGLTGAMKGLAVTTAGVINNLNGMLPEFAEANSLSRDFTRNIELATGAIKLLGGVVAIWGSLRIAIFGATQAQLAFNLAARANPYLLIAGSIAAATYALYEFIGAQDRAVESTQRMWERAASSTAAYQMAMGEVGRTQNTIHELHAQELELQEKMQAMRDKGFKQYGYHANKYAAMENELLELQEKRKSLMDARATAEQNEFKRQEQQQQKELEFARQKEALDKQQAAVAAELARQHKEALSIGRETLKIDKEKDRALEERQRIQKQLEDTAKRTVESLKKSNEALKDEIQSIGKSRRELVEMERQKLRNVIAEKEHALSIAQTTDASDEYISNLKEEIAQLEERGELLAQRIDTQEVYESQQAIADYWQRLSDDMGRTFTDAIINGGASAKDAIKRMFTNFVLRPIIEPIAQGAAGMITNMLGGSGGGGSGGGFGFGNILSMGSSVYSAFTGWGKALYTGFAEGGFSGAVTNMGSYFSGALSGFSAKLGSIFGFGGAAGTASAGGTGFGIGGSLVSGQMGSASYAGGGSAGAGFGGMAAAWPLAVAAGMITSGKLYDQGVRPSVGGIRDAGGNTLLGKAVMGTPALMAGMFKTIDNILKPVVGGKIASMLTGSTLHQAIWGKVGSKLFGSDWKVKDSGITLRASGEKAKTGTYQFSKKSGGLFGKSGSKMTLGKASGSLSTAVQDAYTDMRASVITVFEELSIDTAEDVLKEFKSKTKYISTVGKSKKRIQKDIEKWLGKTADKMSGMVQTEAGTGTEYKFEQLVELVDSMLAMNDVLEMLDMSKFDKSFAGAEFAKSVVDLMGGMEGLAVATDKYYQHFVSAEQQRLDYASAIASAISEAGKDMTAEQLMNMRRDDYKELIQAQDLTTESGRELWAALMQLSESFSELAAVWDALEADRWSAEVELLQAMGREEEALAMIRAEAIKGLTAEQVAYWDRTQAIRQQIKSLEDQRRAHEQLIAKQKQALHTQRSTAADVLREMDAVFKAVSSGAKSLFAEVDSVVRSDMLSSKAFISDALLTAQTTGYLPDAADISSAIRDVQTGLRSEVFASQAEADFERLVVANELKKLEEITGQQMTEQEKQIAALDRQIEQLDLQRERLNEIYDASQIQIDRLEDIDESVHAVEQATAGIADSIIAAQEVASRSMLESIVDAHKVLISELDLISKRESDQSIKLASEYTEFRQQLAMDNEERDENRDQLIVELTEQVIELRKQVDVLNRHAQRTATAVNGRPDQPILVEMVNPPVVVVGER